MNPEKRERIAFACAYTPLALIAAAGFAPYRILPVGSAADRAGSLLHDNLCPHVKRILDRGLAGDLPELAGLVVMNSCDAMRRLADAWRIARPADRLILVDLPVSADGPAAAYFAGELTRLTEELSHWGGRPPASGDAIVESAARYRELALGIASLAERAGKGGFPGGRRTFQGLLNRSVTEPIEDTLQAIRRIETDPGSGSPAVSRVPVYLFGNVLPDPEAFELFEACGAQLVADDVCTGSRQLVAMDLDGGGLGVDSLLAQMASQILARPPCARTLDASTPSRLAEQVLAGARSSGAHGVVAHVMKFCDPYLARMPAVRAAFREAGMPLLVLEGDCTMRSLGQHRTRIEAFVEMLGGNPS